MNNDGREKAEEKGKKKRSSKLGNQRNRPGSIIQSYSQIQHPTSITFIQRPTKQQKTTEDNK